MLKLPLICSNLALGPSVELGDHAAAPRNRDRRAQASAPLPRRLQLESAAARIEPAQIFRQQLPPSGERHAARARQRAPLKPLQAPLAARGSR